ncbi:hypothetical protein K3N28_05800 [Glycomyces sp. TRM65418]|uniref:hypothetical protein n=1 Tax=Glycomyces sp. TRM65418 TaxID=2867006 RepID=UPI001CE654EB|nr:hypothetical protein [Glycomyces sp. TRM65418]MCC3762582.1 hypothetical protein [Glycomyces sp. TRM65418]QZD56621.1 hypothetical protein K3N28_05760 [Glycomyces sp. TRM65418]
MSEAITILLGEGILRRLQVRTVHGPVLAVQLLVEGGPVALRATGLPDEPVVLVAVHLRHRTGRPRQRRGHVLVRRTTVETDHALAAGRLLLFPSSGDAPIDAVTVQPEDPGRGTWLDKGALEVLAGKPVRLEVRHLPSSLAADRSIDSAME